MSKVSYAKWKLEEIKATRKKADLMRDIQISLDFSRSRQDTMSLPGFPQFLDAVHELEPNADDWKWSDDAICKACERSGMSRRSIILKDEPPRNIVIKINNSWR